MLKTLQKNFRVRPLTAAVASVISLTAGSMAYAQDDAEEIVVTGIKASLTAAMDIKRDAAGVVDSISAEDMGKFPDTNLAESLQRITGVSISRQNGEGAEITIRGFGAENNMVTLNGRTLPTGTVYAGGAGADGNSRSGGSRAFNFSNISSDGIAGVDVYKTGKANIATGGIGGTVNVKTTRPLDKPGFRSTISVKALSDTTNRVGDDVTPEVSGLVSWTDDSEMFGAALSLDSQRRDSGSAGVTVNNWNIGVWGTDRLYDTAPNSVFKNAPKAGQLYARPNDFRYGFSDWERERLNGQLTLQFRPTDKITATLDYTYADNDIKESRGEVTNWIQNGSNIAEVVFDGGKIATPLSITEKYNGTVDVGYEQQYNSQSNTLGSLGLNIEFKVSDEFTLTFDAHDSKMKSEPTGPGKSGQVAIGLGAPVVKVKTIDFSSEIPVYSFTTSVANNALTEANVGTSILRIRGAGSENDIKQYKLDGAYKLDDARFDFGIESRDMEMAAYQTSGENQALGNWGVADPGIFKGTGLLRPINIQDEFSDFNVSKSPSIAFRGDAVALTKYALTKYPGHLSVATTNGNDDDITEKTKAVYFQVGFDGKVGNFPASVLTGLRYEHTDVDSASVITPIDHLTWETNNDFSATPGTATVSASAEGKYDNLLPSLDIKVNLRDDLIARAAFSKTIARAGYGALRYAPSGFGIAGSTFNGYTATASSGNPNLLPLESSNTDLSLEYYYADSSYASVGVFEKRVANFLGTGQENRTFGIKDQTSANSPRVQAAVAKLRAANLQTDDTNLYSMMVLLAHPEALNNKAVFPNGVYEATGDQIILLGETKGWDIVPDSSDTTDMVFSTTTQLNNTQAKLYGAEFAVQHFFGETGFGVSANYTLVRGDTHFINTFTPDEDQFALTGLSDTANLVLMYEKDAIQARVAYNWRAEYLTETNQGSSRNPQYVEAYSQIDISLGYEFNENLSVSLEGLNITGEDHRTHNRNSRMIRFADDLGARYALGARYKF